MFFSLTFFLARAGGGVGGGGSHSSGGSSHFSGGSSSHFSSGGTHTFVGGGVGSGGSSGGGDLVALFVFWTHRANIARLRRGEEHRFGKRGTAPSRRMAAALAIGAVVVLAVLVAARFAT